MTPFDPVLPVESSYSSFASALRAQKVVFFAGAGISLASGLPSVADIMGRTGEHFLSNFWRHGNDCPSNEYCQIEGLCHFSWLRSMQPEQFYGLLLKVSNSDYRCLNIWGILSEEVRLDHYSEAFDFRPRPNLVHYLIAHYSHRAGHPIFTVNFDDMFERACDDLDIPFEVRLPDDPPPESWRLQGRVQICKLHGSAQDESGRFTPHALGTTLEDITRFNKPWVDFIRKVMTHTRMTFLGYSGRDIDYFPSIANAIVNENCERPFWFVSADPSRDESSRATLGNARQCNSVIIEGYPSALLSGTGSALHYRELAGGLSKRAERVLAQAAESLTAPQHAHSDAKDWLLDELARNLPRIPESLLWLRILVETGHIVEADNFAQGLNTRNFRASVSPQQNVLFEASRTVIARERGLFSTYRANARALASSARRAGPDGIPALLDARLQYTSSLQMEVPGRFRFAPQLTLSDFALLVWVLVRYHFLDPAYYLALRLKNPSESRKIAQSSTIAEARIRRLAIWVGQHDKLKTRLDSVGERTSGPFLAASKFALALARRQLVRVLTRAEVRASELGNYSTMISVYKYLFRITGDPSWRAKGDRIAAMVGDLSAQTIFMRDASGGVGASESTRELSEAIAGAARGGNRLNEIKHVLELAHRRWMTRDKQSQSHPELVDDIVRLRTLMNDVGADSTRLNRVFQCCLDNLSKAERTS